MSDEALARPTHGARVLARLKADASGDGVYALALATADAEFLGTARIRAANGEVMLEGWTSEAPPPWLAQVTHALLRTAWQRRQAGEPWPRRLSRWRPGPASLENA